MTVLKQISEGLTNDERKIAEIKYKSKPFGAMSPEERLVFSKGALLRIGVITGWQFPAEALMGVLVDQFEKKMIESYPTLNADEMEYAFRHSSVKDWGKQLNISLIDEVMQPYLEKRQIVSAYEQQVRSKELAPSKDDDVSDVGMDEYWDYIQGLVKKGGYPIDLVPVELYGWMDRNGNILFNREEKNRYMERATLVRHTRVSADYEMNPHDFATKSYLTEFNKMRDAGVFSAEESEKIRTLAKKMVVYEMMKTK